MSKIDERHLKSLKKLHKLQKRLPKRVKGFKEDYDEIAVRISDLKDKYNVRRFGKDMKTRLQTLINEMASITRTISSFDDRTCPMLSKLQETENDLDEIKKEINDLINRLNNAIDREIDKQEAALEQRRAQSLEIREGGALRF